MTRMSKAIYIKIIITFAIIVLCAFLSCASTPIAMVQNEEASKGEKVLTTSKTPKTEKPLPPQVLFAQKLRALLDEGDIEGAIALFDTMDESLQSDVDLLSLKVSLLISAKRSTQALALVKRLQAEHPANTQVTELALMVALSMGDKSTKTALTEKLLKANPNNPSANITQARDHISNKKYKLAKKSFQKALQGEPGNSEALLGYAQMCYYTNDMAQSKKALNSLIKLDPANAQAYQYMGKLYAEGENYKEATDCVQKAIALDDTSYEFFLDLGQYLRYQGKYKDAEVAWTRAIELNPDYFLGYAYRAGLRDEQEHFQEALQDYKRVIETNPKYYFAYEEIGILEYHEKNYELARECFLKADSVKSTDAYKLMTFLCYFNEGKKQEAKLYSEKAMKTMERTSLSYKMMRLFHDLGPRNAENALISEIEKETNRTDKGRFMFYLASYFEMQGVTAAAEDYYQKIVTMQAPLFFEYRFAQWAVKAAGGSLTPKPVKTTSTKSAPTKAASSKTK